MCFLCLFAANEVLKTGAPGRNRSQVPALPDPRPRLAASAAPAFDSGREPNYWLSFINLSFQAGFSFQIKNKSWCARQESNLH